MRCVLIIPLLAYTISVSAQTSGVMDTTEVVELENVIITQNRFEIPFPEANRNISIVTRQDIARTPGRNAVDVLKYVPGVDLRQRGISGVQADVGLLGGSFEQSLVLVNGLKMTDPQTGHHMLNLPIPKQSIQEIQVLKGSGARIFGQNAYAGAINIITAPPKDDYFSVGMYGGSFGTVGVQSGLSLHDGNLAHGISITHERSDGYRYNTDYALTNLFYQNTFEALNGDFQFMGGFSDREFGANGFYGPPQADFFTDQYEEVETGMLALIYDRKIDDQRNLKSQVYWRTNHDDYVLLRDQPQFYNNIHTTQVFAWENHYTYQASASTKVGLGIDLRHESINSNLLGTRARRNFGAYGEIRTKVGENFDFTPGMYANWNNEFNWNFFYGLEAGLNPVKNFRIWISASSAYRIPSFTDLYYEDPGNIGNPDLLPEEAVTLEAGTRYVKGTFFADASVFRRESSESIDWALNADNRWEIRNFGDGVTQGVELVLRKNFNNPGKGPAIQAIYASYNFINARLDSTSNITSRNILENLKHQVVASLDHRFWKNLYGTLKYRFSSRVPPPNLEDFNLTTPLIQEYSLFDYRLEWKSPAWNIFFEIQNIGDKAYTEINFIPMPGRSFQAGLTYTLWYY